MKKIKLGDVLDIKRGITLSGKYYAFSGQYIRLTLGNFMYPECGWKDNKAKDNLYFVGRIKESAILKKGDIITPLTEQVRGLLGNTATIPKDNTYVQSGDIGLVIPNEKLLDKRFSYYLISSKVVKKQLDVSSQQTKIRHTSPDNIKSCIAYIPLIEDQRKIANILDLLNERIENNKKINETLQQQLKLLYDYWFMQFDFPDENGKPYKSSGGKMVWNERLKREIPVNFEVASLCNNSLTSIIKPGVDYFSTKKYFATADISGTDILDGTLIEFETRESRANMQPTLNSVWFAKMKNSLKHLYLNNEMKSLIDNSILSTGFCGLQCSDKSFEYISSFVEHSYFETIKDTLAHGATQEAVNNDDLNNIPIVIPSNRVLDFWHKKTLAMYAEISKNICENKKLIKLRDWLLPMLMNGQATISD